MANSSDVDELSAILSSLFESKGTKVWDGNRANKEGFVKPEELPALDPKWVRLNTKKILDVIEAILQCASWKDSEGSGTHAQILWRQFLGSISVAGNKEVKPSNELMNSVAHIMSFLSKVWSKGSKALNAGYNDGHKIFLKRFAFLATSTLDILGPIPFTERSIFRKSGGLFEAIHNHSYRSPKRVSQSVRSPLFYLFELLSTATSTQSSEAEIIASLAKDILAPCCKSRGSRKAKMEMLRECVQLLSQNTVLPRIAE